MELIEQYLGGEIDAGTFQREYMPLWRVTRDAQGSQGTERPDPYIVQLIEAHKRGEISPRDFETLTGEDFNTRWEELRDYTDLEAVWELLGSVFVNCDFLEVDPSRILTPRPNHQWTEERFHREMVRSIRRYEAGLSQAPYGDADELEEMSYPDSVKRMPIEKIMESGQSANDGNR